jgi:hypothetical protein
LIASAHWSAWFWDLFERSTPSAVPIVIWMTAGFTFYGIVLIRTVRASSRGWALSKFGYWYIRASGILLHTCPGGPAHEHLVPG